MGRIKKKEVWAKRKNIEENIHVAIMPSIILSFSYHWPLSATSMAIGAPEQTLPRQKRKNKEKLGVKSQQWIPQNDDWWWMEEK